MKILDEIQNMSIEMKSNYNDGFTQLYYKNKLLMIKDAVDKALNDAPTFHDEDHYIKQYRNINTNVT